MKESIVFDKSKSFALRIIALYKYLCNEKREFILSKQLLRSGTSIGANIRLPVSQMPFSSEAGDKRIKRGET